MPAFYPTTAPVAATRPAIAVAATRPALPTASGLGSQTTFTPMTGAEQRVFDAARIASLSRLAQAQNEQTNEGIKAELKYLADQSNIRRNYADERSNANVAAGSRGLALSPATMARLAQSLMNRQAADTARAKQVELDRKAVLQKNTDSASFNYLQTISDLAQRLANNRGETASSSLIGTY